MNDKPTVVTLEPKNDMQAASDALRRQLPILLDNLPMIAQLRRASYLAHVAVGFTPAEALELCRVLS